MLSIDRRGHTGEGDSAHGENLLDNGAALLDADVGDVQAGNAGASKGLPVADRKRERVDANTVAPRITDGEDAEVGGEPPGRPAMKQTDAVQWTV